MNEPIDTPAEPRRGFEPRDTEKMSPLALVEGGGLTAERDGERGAPVAREPSVREPSVREPSVREPSVREPSVREPWLHHTISREMAEERPRPPRPRRPTPPNPALERFVAALASKVDGPAQDRVDGAASDTQPD